MPFAEGIGARTSRFTARRKKLFTYIAFYRGKEIQVQALRSYDAQRIAAEKFKARKAYEVTVILAAKNGEPVTHDPAIL